MLTVMFTVTGLFGGLLGIASFISLKEAKDNANSTLRDVSESARSSLTNLRMETDQALKELRAVRDETKKQYPTLAGVDENVHAILTELHAVFAESPSKEDDFNNLDPGQRQKLFFWEKALATMDLLNMTDQQHAVSRIFQGYANLYASRYWVTLESARKRQTDSPSDADLDRARFYYERALQLDPTNVQALNDQGFYHMDHGAQLRIDIARTSFLDSVARVHDQQRPHFNLALIELHHYRDFDAALRFADRALQGKYWDLRDHSDGSADIRYHRAVILARLAESAEDESRKAEYASRAIADLEAACADPSENHARWLRIDCQDGEAFGRLLKKEGHAGRIESVRNRINEKWHASTT